MAVAGVVLGIGTLLWATSGTSGDAGSPTVSRPVAAGAASPVVDQPAVPDVAAPSAPAATSPSPDPSPASPASAAAAPAAAAPAHPAVLVLNDSRIPALAARAAAQFAAAGWPVQGTGSLHGTIRATTVYYLPGQQDEAQAFARQFPGVRRVLPRLAELPGSGLTVVVTRDWNG